MPVRVRKAQPADREYCLRLDHTVTTEYAWRMEQREDAGGITVAFQTVRLPRPVSVPYPRREEDLTAGWDACDLFIVAEEEKRIVGYATARALPGHGVCWIHDVVVDPSYRQKGVGRALVGHVGAWALEKGLRELVMEIPLRNYPATCFCRALGFSLRGYHDHHWRSSDIALLFGVSLR